MEVQPIASPRYKQLKREIDDLEDKKHPVVIQPIVAPAKIYWDPVEGYDDSYSPDSNGYSFPPDSNGYSFLPDPDDEEKRKQKLLENIYTLGDAFSQLGSSFQDLGSAFEIPELNYAGILL